MPHFATVDDVADRWRPLSDAERTLAQVLIGDATNILLVTYPDINGQVLAGTVEEWRPRQVVAGMVKRAIIGGDNEGVKSDSETVGPYSLSRTYANALGSLFLTDADRVLILGPQPAAVSVPYGC
jgi:hypothetical protein